MALEMPSTSPRDSPAAVFSTVPVTALLDAAPDALITVDANGRIVLVNIQTERLFEYFRQELVDQPIELLIPERLRSVHVEDRATYVEQPRVRPMGHVGLELVG